LDAIGDLYVLGAPILGRFEGILAGHGINNAVVLALLEQPSAWRMTMPALDQPMALAKAG
jgi:UDP-3-O-[3-hydroxymyristoyl] N-acetylglucosamine deacetylase